MARRAAGDDGGNRRRDGHQPRQSLLPLPEQGGDRRASSASAFEARMTPLFADPARASLSTSRISGSGCTCMFERMGEYRFILRDVDVLAARDRDARREARPPVAAGHRDHGRVVPRHDRRRYDDGVRARDRRAGATTCSWSPPTGNRSTGSGARRRAERRRRGSGSRRVAGALADRALSRPVTRARWSTGSVATTSEGDRPVAKKWVEVSARRQGVCLRCGGIEEALGASAQGRLRAVPQGRRGAGRVAPLSRRRFRAGGRCGQRGGRRRRERGDQGAGRLRDLSREERQGEARAARGGDGLGRGAGARRRRRTRMRTTSSRSRRAAMARASRSRRRSRRGWAARSRTRS